LSSAMPTCFMTTYDHRRSQEASAKSVQRAMPIALPAVWRQCLPEVERALFAVKLTARMRAKFRFQRRLSFAVPREGPEWVLRDWRAWSALQVRGVTGGGDGIGDGVSWFRARRQRVMCRWAETPTYFWRNLPADIDATVHRKPDGVSVVGRSAGKVRRAESADSLRGRYLELPEASLPES